MIRSILYEAMAQPDTDIYMTREPRLTTAARPQIKPTMALLHTYTIKGITIEAKSRKDAIKRLKHQNRI